MNNPCGEPERPDIDVSHSGPPPKRSYRLTSSRGKPPSRTTTTVSLLNGRRHPHWRWRSENASDSSRLRGRRQGPGGPPPESLRLLIISVPPDSSHIE